MGHTIATTQDSEGNTIRWKRRSYGKEFRRVTVDKHGRVVKTTPIVCPPTGTLMVFDERTAERATE
jgi:hypothetical protein